jgi:hypothetical protein
MSLDNYDIDYGNDKGIAHNVPSLWQILFILVIYKLFLLAACQ